MSSLVQSPTLEILAREPEVFSIWKGPPFSNGQPLVKLEKVICTAARFSENGSRLMVTKSNTVISVQDCCSSTEIRSFDIPSLLAATLSPCGTYLQTFQKSTTPQDKNVVLWEVQTGAAVYQHFQKNMSKTTWPSIIFTSDESVACRMATNEIQFFDSKDFSKGIIHRLRLPGIAAIELSKAPGPYIAAFVPESKGIPASVQIFSCSKDAQTQPIARRSFFRCSTVALHWNKISSGVLVVAQSDVDKSNQSYYGESKLNYLTTDGSHEGLVPLRSDSLYYLDADRWGYPSSSGPVHLAHAIYPCELSWLVTDDAFWDYTEKKVLGTTKAEWSVTSEWSPDGQYFMTATTAPRLQIDNGIKIFRYDGSLYFKKMFSKLYQADWKPEAPERFDDINELVKSVETLKIDNNEKKVQVPKSSSETRSNVQASSVQKPAAYRPPHAKNAASVKAELFGGMAPSEEMSKNALRNKKRREKQKEKKAAEASAAASSS
ncbi:hypothetical protein C4D60_Mb06t29530 [Musa balbisiana]|uniref:Eukaryotic translation initiation factor 2A n=1 Tax=Musa balbisiana TaxID=52838 RepID=A0A4S8ISB8_MUSBA|nr:hypothetical protein C4D60_Mb06t29530 [Musa balbisiana]